jgi:hypothetical protein
MATFNPQTSLQPSQGRPTTTAPGSSSSLPGQTYSGAFGNALNYIPGVGGLLSSLYGSKPATENPGSSASQAINENIGNFGATSQLTLGNDAISGAGAALPFQMNLPDYDSMLTQASTNTGQELSGQVPQDVQNLLSQQASERGISTGQAPGSPNTEAAYLQALGLTSMGQQQQGQSNLSQLIGETPTGAGFNPSSMQVTPAEQQAADQQANTVAAAPDPVASGLMSTFMSFI